MTIERRLIGEVVSARDLSQHEKERMFQLLEAHFENTSRTVFENDLMEKQLVIMLRDSITGELQGFSTQMVIREIVDSVPVRVLFSGDTIIAKDRWGDVELTRVWGRFALQLADEEASVRLYWYLISQGYRTYRFLPLYFKRYYPNQELSGTTFEKRLVDTLSAKRYGARYDEAAGVIRADATKDFLKEGIAPVSEERTRNPHIRFFASVNPRHAQGDELACIAEISKENFNPGALRVFFWKTR